MKRSKFNLGHYKLTTTDMGKLIPVGLMEVLPGDTFQHSTNALVRLSPMAAPVYHSMNVRLHHWFVPHRLVWSGFEDFITGGPDGRDVSTPPQITTSATSKTLLDYFGVPPVAGVSVSALPVRGFNMVWNNFYRDQDLVNQRTEDDISVPAIAWEKDYFTTCRPWAQKGDEVTVPVGGSGGGTFAVNGLGTLGTSGLGFWDQNVSVTEQDGTKVYAQSAPVNPTASGNLNGGKLIVKGTGQYGRPDISVTIPAGGGGSVNIDEFRRAFAIQRFQEARARYGSRYVEYLRYLGVQSSDARLDLPEYLGGGSVRISVSEVLQTAPEGADTAQGDTPYGVGDLYGHGIAAARSNAYRRFFEEHGYVITVLSIRPKTLYQNGIDRTWLKKDREDFYQKELQYIGQQHVLLNEVYADPVAGDGVFGYQDRYAEYKQQMSHVTAEFRDLLNYWHLGRNFDSAPTINGTFVTCDPSKRIFNEQTQDSCWIMVQHRCVARRLVDKSAASRIM